MNWTKGVFRLWMAATCFWVTSTALVAMLSWPSKERSVFITNRSTDHVRWAYPFSIEVTTARLGGRLRASKDGYSVILDRDFETRSEDAKQYWADDAGEDVERQYGDGFSKIDITHHVRGALFFATSAPLMFGLILSLLTWVRNGFYSHNAGPVISPTSAPATSHLPAKRYIEPPVNGRPEATTLGTTFLRIGVNSISWIFYSTLSLMLVIAVVLMSDRKSEVRNGASTNIGGEAKTVWPEPNERHVAHLKANPGLTDEFEKKFGPYSASKALGIAPGPQSSATQSVLTTEAISNFVLFKLPLGVEVQIPRGWWLLGSDLLKIIETSAEAGLDVSGVGIPDGQKVTLIAANSMPRSTYAAIRINWLPDVSSG